VIELSVTAGGCKASEKVVELPPTVATRTAVAAAETLAAVTVKLALVAPAAITTDAGRVTCAAVLPTPSVTATGVVAADVKLTVHVALPGVTTVPGLHDIPEKSLEGAIVRVAPVAVALTALAAAEAASGKPTWIVDELAAVVDTPNVTVATTPFAIGLVFIPQRTQVYDPAALAQLIDFPAATAAAPATALMAVKSADEYWKVPAAALRDKFSVAVPPCVVEPEDKLNALCPEAVLCATSTRSAAAQNFQCEFFVWEMRNRVIISIYVTLRERGFFITIQCRAINSTKPRLNFSSECNPSVCREQVPQSR
jgi:hypothetical protein